MINLTFKNVGQGDSIILEWICSKTSEKKIAIIDCNNNESNPILEHLISEDYKNIEFIILSHPHYDHFSGFTKVLQHCISERIFIKYFVHTCDSVPEFIQTANRTKTAKKAIQELFLLMRELPLKLGTKIGAMSSDSVTNFIPIDYGIKLIMLSPSLLELDNYRKGVNFGKTEEEASNDTNANWLSTVFQILLPNNTYALLTSDCSSKSLTRIGKSNFDEDHKLLIGQSPHHGAAGNHTGTFWRMRKYDNDIPVVFSVGKNNYKHPSQKAIKDFIKYNYKIHSTGQFGALGNTLNRSERTSTYLSMFSKPVYPENRKNNRYNGDKKFNISLNGINYLSQE